MTDWLILGAAVVIALVMGYRLFPQATETVAGRSGLGVDTLVGCLQQELQRVEAELVTQGRSPLFKLKEATVDLSFVVTNSTTKDEKVEFKVLTFGSSAQQSRQDVQRLTVTWTAAEGRQGQSVPEDGFLANPSGVKLNSPPTSAAKEGCQ